MLVERVDFVSFLTQDIPRASTAMTKRIDLAMGYSGASGEWHADFRGLGRTFADGWDAGVSRRGIIVTVG